MVKRRSSSEMPFDLKKATDDSVNQKVPEEVFMTGKLKTFLIVCELKNFQLIKYNVFFRKRLQN